MFACADCPRKVGAACGVVEEVAAALVGERCDETSMARKPRCLHPDKPLAFACGDCPRKVGVAPEADFDGEVVAAAGYIGEKACGADALMAQKPRCIHPDKPLMFACADCPRKQ